MMKIIEIKNLSYEQGLINEASKYCEDCQPEVVDNPPEFEGYDECGQPIFSYNPIMTCHECEEKDCEYWEQFHLI